MKHLTHTLLAALVLMVTAASDKAAAQAPNMDMSWALTTCRKPGDTSERTAAQAYAQAYYNYMMNLRLISNTSQSLPTAVTPDTLRASLQWIQKSMDPSNPAPAPSRTASPTPPTRQVQPSPDAPKP